MKLTLITFIINASRFAVSRNNRRTIVSVTSFRLLPNQVSRNIVLAPRSVMITISYHFISQSDCSILSKVTRIIFPNIYISLKLFVLHHAICFLFIYISSASDLGKT